MTVQVVTATVVSIFPRWLGRAGRNKCNTYNVFLVKVFWCL